MTAAQRRRVVTWAAIVVVLAVVGALGAFIASSMQWTQRDAFDPESAGPSGTRALARILEDRGVEVVVTRDAAATRAALGDGDATLVLLDSPYLDDDRMRELAASADEVVVPDARSRAARVLADGAVAGFGPASPVAPGCDLAAAERAGAVLVGATFSAPEARGCYPGDEGWGLLTVATESGATTLLDASELFTNARLREDGNAALAVNLLGGRERLVWFVPALSEAAGGAAPSLGSLTPSWVSPAIVLLLAAALAAALWRGRRFGPLVHERLPVVVRGDETTRGRGRLYARSRDAGHAAARLREGTIGRLARAAAVGRHADAETVSDAVAAITALPRAEVIATLSTDPVADDRDLVDLSARLTALEERLAHTLRPRKDPR